MIIITGDNTIEIDNVKYKIVRGESFNPAYTDFEPRVLHNTDPGTGGLIVEFGYNRLANTTGDIEQIIVSSCDRYILQKVS